jgi:hypothetical protein
MLLTTRPQLTTASVGRNSPAGSSSTGDRRCRAGVGRGLLAAFPGSYGALGFVVGLAMRPVRSRGGPMTRLSGLGSSCMGYFHSGIANAHASSVGSHMYLRAERRGRLRSAVLRPPMAQNLGWAVQRSAWCPQRPGGLLQTVRLSAEWTELNADFIPLPTRSDAAGAEWAAAFNGHDGDGQAWPRALAALRCLHRRGTRAYACSHRWRVLRHGRRDWSSLCGPDGMHAPGAATCRWLSLASPHCFDMVADASVPMDFIGAWSVPAAAAPGPLRVRAPRPLRS